MSRILFPPTVQEATRALQQGGVVRAAGTDLSHRRHRLHDDRDLVDLRDLAGLSDVAWVDWPAAPRGPAAELEPGSTPPGGAPGAASPVPVRPGDDAVAAAPPLPQGLRLGASMRLAQLAQHPELQKHWPGLAAAAGGLATPQVRARATLGGSIRQGTRCVYALDPRFHCYRSGGDTCPAREGDHLFHACFDLSPCIAVHPSTMGAALLAYEARVELAHGLGGDTEEADLVDAFGDGTDPTRGDAIPPDALLTAVLLPPPVAGESAVYLRTISRARAEWPLVEVVVRVGVTAGRIDWARVVVGGVAPVPLRRESVEAELVGQAVDAELVARAAGLAPEGAQPLPGTRYKLELLRGTVQSALERALGLDSTGQGEG